jgi:exosortase family protein XrtF
VLQKLKEILSQNRASLVFMGRFVLFYTVLSLLYFGYLVIFKNQPDFLTVWTGKIAQTLIQFFGYQSNLILQSSSSTLELHVEGQYLARIIEGCNGISVTLLFVAFVWAYGGTSRITWRFVLLGGLSVFVLNWFRIALLSIALYEFPQAGEPLHQLVFPAVIYGWIVFLWLAWVFKFSKL